MYKEPKETMTMMSSKRETLSEEIESIKRKQTEILELIHSKWIGEKKKHHCEPRILYPIKIVFKNEGEIKPLQDKQ